VIPENKLKKILFIIVSSTLLIYILITETAIAITSSINITLISNITYAIKTASFAVSILVSLMTAKSSFIAKFFLKDKYIAGKYKGIANRINENNEVLYSHQEEIIVVQNLLSIKISGESKDGNDGYYAKYYGFAISTNEDIDYYEFMVKVNTNRSTHTGIFELTIRDGQLKGYLPSRTGKWNIDLKKVS